MELSLTQTGINPDSEMASHTVASALGTATRAIIHYGSRVHGAGVRASSEYDFVVVVDDYESALRSLVTTTSQRFSVFTGALLSRVLPPTIISVSLPGADEKVAKCVVYSARDFDRACSAAAPDHFLKGRLCQHVVIAWSRDHESRLAADNGIRSCRHAVLDWVATSLPPTFSTEEFCQMMLQVSYAAEIRPEQKTRALQVLAAQREELLPIYGDLLMNQVSQGRLAIENDRFLLVEKPNADAAAAWAAYFRTSKARATTRWFKSVWLYRGWMAYLKQKNQRRGFRAERRGVHSET